MTVDAAAVARRVVADASEQHPDATIEYEQSDELDAGAPIRVVEEGLFEMAIAELVENAVVHSDRGSPQVIVGVESDGDRIRLFVADDGPGIPDDEVAAVTSRTETHLEHSSGLGLWLVQWTASLSSADLSFTANEPRGTVVALVLSSAED